MSDADQDVFENPAIGRGQPGTKVADGAFRRNMMIIGGVVGAAILGVILMAVLSSGGSKGQSGEVRVEAMAGQSQARPDHEVQPTPAMQEMLRKKQAEEAEAARRTGKSYAPTESLGKTEKIEDQRPAGAVNAPMQPSTMQSSAANFGAGSQYSENDVRAMREGLKTQLALMFPSAQAQTVRQRLEAVPAETAGSAAGARSGAAQTLGPAAAGPASSAADGEALIGALEIYPGRLANPITAIKGKSSYASAILTAGPYAGAFMTGTATLTDTEAIDIVFDKIRIGKKAYKVSAKLLDEQTADAGMRGSIDRRILQRYVLPVAAATLQGFFQASAQTGSMVTSGTGGVLASSVPAPTEEQARSAGIAAGMGILSREVAQSAQEPIRSSAARDVTIGVMFLNVVSQKDELK